MFIINEFKDKYRFLSNFVPCTVILESDGFEYPSVEHGYQAEKSVLCCQREKIRKTNSPGKVKSYSKRIQLRPDWEGRKIETMKSLLEQKFSKEPFRSQLLETKDAYLIEGNYWHDNFWGSCYCDKCGDKGKNVLGKLLMEVRNGIKD